LRLVLQTFAISAADLQLVLQMPSCTSLIFTERPAPRW